MDAIITHHKVTAGDGRTDGHLVRVPASLELTEKTPRVIYINKGSRVSEDPLDHKYGGFMRKLLVWLNQEEIIFIHNRETQPGLRMRNVHTLSRGAHDFI